MEDQGVIRRKNAAYMVVCEYFEEACNIDIERKMHFCDRL